MCIISLSSVVKLGSSIWTGLAGLYNQLAPGWGWWPRTDSQLHLRVGLAVGWPASAPRGLLLPRGSAQAEKQAQGAFQTSASGTVFYYLINQIMAKPGVYTEGQQGCG